MRRGKVWTQQRLSEESSIPLTTIKRWEAKNAPDPTIDFASIELLAKVYGFSPSDFMKEGEPKSDVLQIFQNGQFEKLPPGLLQLILSDARSKYPNDDAAQFNFIVERVSAFYPKATTGFRLVGNESSTIAALKQIADEKEAEPGIDSSRIQPVHEIPVWDIDVAAGRWISVPVAELDYEDPYQRQIINAGKFRLRIIGDCMEPEYPSQCIIEFEIIRVDLHGLQEGHDYCLCRSDGTATFKRLISQDEDVYELAAINQQKHPGSFTVPRQEIGRVARVLYKLIEPTPGPVKLKKLAK